MTETWLLAALWLGLALAASLLSICLRIATALSEIVVGAIAQLLIGKRPAPPPVVFIRVHATLRLLGGIPDGKKTWAGLLAEAP